MATNDLVVLICFCNLFVQKFSGVVKQADSFVLKGDHIHFNSEFPFNQKRKRRHTTLISSDSFLIELLYLIIRSDNNNVRRRMAWMERFANYRIEKRGIQQPASCHCSSLPASLYSTYLQDARAPISTLFSFSWHHNTPMVETAVKNTTLSFAGL